MEGLKLSFSILAIDIKLIFLPHIQTFNIILVLLFNFSDLLIILLSDAQVFLLQLFVVSFQFLVASLEVIVIPIP